jgi:cell division inhibitor SepF
MSALRKAGVWLGLIEDDDDRGYGYDDRGYDDDYAEDEFADASAMVRNRVADRLAEARAERNSAAPVERTVGHQGRSVSRMSSPAPETPAARMRTDTGYQTRDNLALAAVPEEEPEPQHEPAPDTSLVPVQQEERRYQITTLHPMTFNDARTIGEHFRDGVPVILNLTEMAEADAKRLVDFAAGLAFGLRGSMERVTNRVFLLSPANIQVTAEDKAKIAEGGFFYQ